MIFLPAKIIHRLPCALAQDRVIVGALMEFAYQYYLNQMISKVTRGSGE
jgi:hypothetical protein